MIFAVLVAVGTGLLVPAFSVALAYLFFRDARVNSAAGGGRTAHRLALVDPHEAARAVGSWG